MKSKWVKKFVLVLWIILSVTLIIMSIKSNVSYILPLIVGEIASFIGLSSVFRSFVGWFLFDVGLGFMVYPVAQIFGIDHIASKYIKEIVLFLGGLIAIQLFFDDGLRNKGVKKRCTTPYEAKCISFEQSSDSTYIPVYKYMKDGKVRMYYGNGKSSVNPKLGDVITVFVNKKNEKEVYCPTSKAILMVRYLAGMMVLAFSTGAIIVL